MSTDQQAKRDGDPEGYSIPAYSVTLVAEGRGLGADVVDEFVDRGESAKTADRPALQPMLERIRRSATSTT